MKIALFADLHMRSEGFENIAAAWRRALQAAHERGAENLAVLGDVFDHCNIVRDGAPGREHSLGTVVAGFMKPLNGFLEARKSAGAIVLSGNHDQAGPGEMDALAAIERDRVCVIRSPQSLDVGGLRVACMPWMNKAAILAAASAEVEALTPEASGAVVRKYISRALAELISPPDVESIFLAHCEVSGATNAKGYNLVGGSFELTVDDIKSVRADQTFLGHIHMRQEIPGVRACYVGALCQLSYGDEGAPTGFAIYDTTAKLIEWVEIESARYRTFSAADYKAAIESGKAASELTPGDLVRVRGTPEDLKEIAAAQDALEKEIENDAFWRLELEPEAIRHEIQARTDAEVTPDEDPLSLLEIWHKESACAVALEPLKIKAAKLLETAPLAPVAIGAIDRIDSLKVKGFCRHNETVLNLAGAAGLIGIVGPNGVGKTALMESLMGVLYGRGPSYGEIYNWLPAGFSGDATQEMALQSGGRRYRLARNVHVTKKTRTQEAYAFELNGETEPAALAGPKVNEYERAVRAIAGDEKLLLSSCFESQDGTGDLIKADPAERKDIFRKLLGTDRWQATSDAAGKEADRIDRETAAAQNDLTVLRATASAGPDAQARLQSARESQTSAEQRLNELRANLDAIQTERLTHAGKANAGDQAAKLLEAHKEKCRTVTDRKDTAAKRIEEIDALLSRPDSSEALRAEISGMNAQDTDLLNREAARAALLAERSKIQEAAEAITKVRDEQADAMHTEIADHVAERNAIQEELRLLKEQAVNLKHSAEICLDRLRSILTNLQHRTAILEKGNFDGPTCPTCPLLTDAFEARDAIPAAESAVQAAEADLAAGKYLPPAHTKRAEDVERLIAAQKEKIERLQKEAEAFLAETAGRLQPLRDQYKAVKIEASLQPEIEEIRKQRASKQTALDAAPKLDDLRNERVQVQAALVAAKALLGELSALTEALRADVAAGQAARGEMSRLEKEIGEKKTGIQLAEDALVQARQAVLQAEQTVNEVAAAAASVEKLSASLAGLESDRNDYAALQRAFGRDGIPQLIIAAAFPQLQSILDDLCAELGGGFGIALRTQTEVKSTGALKEDFGIIVSDDLGERDIKYYSGGQRKLLRCMFRIGMAVFQAHRSGRKIRVFVADEAFDSLDGPNSEALLRVFHRLQEHFTQIFIISHSSSLVSHLPTVFVLESAPSGVLVSRS